MVQTINAKAILTLASVARRPALLVPHLSVPTISDVNYEALRQYCGGVLFDKDNTLTAPYASDIHPDAHEGLKNAIQAFGVDRVAILSNSAGTNDDPEYKEAQRIEESLGIAVIRHKEKKPGGLDEVLKHFDETDPARLCMVGDRLLTDIVFGNLHGMLTVHSLPLCEGKENKKDNWTAKIIRPVENTALYGNWFGGRRLRRKQLQHKHWPGEDECPLRL